jgi:hypothetical protein
MKRGRLTLSILKYVSKFVAQVLGACALAVTLIPVVIISWIDTDFIRPNIKIDDTKIVNLWIKLADFVFPNKDYSQEYLDQ